MNVNFQNDKAFKRTFTTYEEQIIVISKHFFYMTADKESP